MATSNFSFLPLWKVNQKTGADFDAALHEVQRNTMPRRKGLQTMDEDTSNIYKTNINALQKLHAEASSHYDTKKDATKSQFIFANATLMNNRNATQVFVDRLTDLALKDRSNCSFSRHQAND